MPTPFSLAGLSEQQACWGQGQGRALTCWSPALCPSLPVVFPVAMKPLPGSAPAHGPWRLTLGAVWAAEWQEQREWELPDPHGPGLRTGPRWLCPEQGCCAHVCMSVPSFGKGCRAHGDAALSCACQGWEFMLVAELWHPLCCRAPEWLLPSLQSKRTWAKGSLASTEPAVGTALPHIHRGAQGPAVGLLRWISGSWQPPAPHLWQKVPVPCCSLQENTPRGHPSSRNRRQHRGAANGAVIYCCHGNDHTVTC